MAINKILILNASPRHTGSISRLLASMRDEASSNGCEVETINISDADIRPCCGCMVCRTKGVCVLPEDDAQRILAKIKECDTLIIGSPTYWANMPSTLKALFDRTVYGFIHEDPGHQIPRPSLRGKRAMIIVTCTTPYPFNILLRESRGTIKAIRHILKMSGFHIVATMQRGGLKTKPINDNDLKKARQLILKIIGVR